MFCGSRVGTMNLHLLTALTASLLYYIDQLIEQNAQKEICLPLVTVFVLHRTLSPMRLPFCVALYTLVPRQLKYTFSKKIMFLLA